MFLGFHNTLKPKKESYLPDDSYLTGTLSNGMVSLSRSSSESGWCTKPGRWSGIKHGVAFQAQFDFQPLHLLGCTYQFLKTGFIVIQTPIRSPVHFSVHSTVKIQYGGHGCSIFIYISITFYLTSYLLGIRSYIGHPWSIF